MGWLTDLVPAEAVLVVAIDGLVEVEDQVRAVRDDEAAGVLDLLGLEVLELLDELRQVHHHAVADHARRLGVQDARRDQVELVHDALQQPSTHGADTTVSSRDSAPPVSRQASQDRQGDSRPR